MLGLLEYYISLPIAYSYVSCGALPSTTSAAGTHYSIKENKTLFTKLIYV